MPYTVSEENPKIATFLQNHHVASLATATTSGAPHVATVYTVNDENLTLFFITKSETTKTRNILANPQVALSISDAQTLKTLQILGQAKKVEDSARAERILALVTNIVHQTNENATPPVSKLTGGDYIAFEVTPHSLRLAEFVKPAVAENENLFDIAVLPETE